MRRAPTLFGSDEVEMGALRLRRMVLSDLTDVMALEKRAFKNPWSQDLLRRELTHEWSTVLLAQENQQLLGFVIFWVVHDEIHVLNVAVDPPHRRKGVARSVLAEIIGRARTAGARLVTLEVRRTNVGAIALYEGLGFRRVGLRPNYYSDEGEDAIVMTLEL